MIIECRNCGAPLDVRPGMAVVECRYCGKTSQIAGTRTLNAVTPPDWQPPAQWTEQDRERARQLALAGVGIAAATTGVGAVLFVIVVLGGLTLLGLGIFLAFALR